jgi:hypothetical protein
MQDFEKLGLFYLGRQYDMAGGRALDDLVLYDSRDLVTHAVCVGMTGSGKTGLCLSLLEEAAIDGVPVIAIDPKGDLGNLLLTFPGLSGAEFRPWVDEDEARRKGQTAEAYAVAEAERWRAGLADWGQDGARIERLKRSAEFTIYTPGSRAGVPVSILSSFAAPTGAARVDGEALADRADSTATSVLSLAGVDAPPRSREHTLVSSLFGVAWAEGRDLDLPALIQQVQTPPFAKVGVVDVEAFFPGKERFDLAMRLNGLLAAPGFAEWLEGAPLDPASLLYSPKGTPRVAIFSIAHLGDAERMFFVSLLLNQIVGWMRGLTGTTSLRAIVYMDEIHGYFPPVSNPPSKAPLLTLLKQGRAFGLGVVLATQNPVDLDYKGLANTGTWFLGRLQTERDKARMLDGLGAETDRLLSALDKRVFLLHNVHEKAPVVFQTRWTLSYLRGPLSRDQIRALTPEAVPLSREAGASAPESGGQRPMAGPRPGGVGQKAGTGAQAQLAPPIVPPGIQQYFVPATAASGRIRYSPVVIGAARVAFGDTKLGIEEVRDVVYAAPFDPGAVAVDWTTATALEVATGDLREAGEAGAVYDEVPAAGLQARSYGAWSREFAKWLAQSEKLELMRQRDLKLTSRSGESERDFQVRVRDAQRVARDAAIDAMRRKYATRKAQLDEQKRRAAAAVERESAQASQQKLQTGLSMGATILGAIFGRKAIGVGSLGRATTAARGVGRSMKEADDIRRASENLDAVEDRVRALEDEVTQETRRITEQFDAASTIERMSVAPKRGQVSVQIVGLGWLPERD